MGRCPPGVVCIENMTVTIIVIIVLIIMYFLYNYMSIDRAAKSDYTVNISNTSPQNQLDTNSTGLYPRPGYSFSNIENDVLLNPYQAPLRDNRIFPNANLPHRMPINVPTQSYDSSYRQIGILTRIGTKETILPLLGRPLITNRDKWNFYTLSENNNLLKLPISHRGRKCMSQNGCDDLYTGDTVKIDGYEDSFKVTTYENDSPKYIPYI